LTEASDGGYVLAGTVSFGTIYWDRQIDGWLIKTDMNGNIEWNRIYGGIKPDSFISLVEAPNGRYVIAGTTKPFCVGDEDF